MTTHLNTTESRRDALRLERMLRTASGTTSDVLMSIKGYSSVNLRHLESEGLPVHDGEDLRVLATYDDGVSFVGERDIKGADIFSGCKPVCRSFYVHRNNEGLYYELDEFTLMRRLPKPH
jgi:hypothetical protein